MKTKSILLAAFFTLNISLLFAGNESISYAPVTETNTVKICTLGPVAPQVASFEDELQMPELASLAPTAPAEADFSDSVQPFINFETLAPVVPAVADFE